MAKSADGLRKNTERMLWYSPKLPPTKPAQMKPSNSMTDAKCSLALIVRVGTTATSASSPKAPSPASSTRIDPIRELIPIARRYVSRFGAGGCHGYAYIGGAYPLNPG